MGGIEWAENGIRPSPIAKPVISTYIKVCARQVSLSSVNYCVIYNYLSGTSYERITLYIEMMTSLAKYKLGQTNVYSRNIVRCCWRVRKHISDTKIGYHRGCTYLSKFNIWLLTSSFDISKQISLYAKWNLADVRVRERTSHIQRAYSSTLTMEVIRSPTHR